MKKYFTTMEEVKASKDEKNTIEFIASKEVADRDNEIIAIKGIDLKNYKKNPIVLFAHNRQELPIGKAVGITKSGDSLKMKVEFADEETYPFAHQVYKLVKGGYLNAVSIGFSADYKEVSYDEKKNTRTFNKTELFELSIVPLPANADALATGKEMMSVITKALEDDVINEEEVKAWEDYLDEEVDPTQELIKELENRVKVLEEKLNTETKEENYFDDLFKEFGIAGGTDDSDPNTDAIDQDDLLKALKDE